MKIAPADVQQLMELVPGHGRTDALEPGIGPQAKQAQQEPALEGVTVEHGPSPHPRKALGTVDASVGLVEHVEQARQGPAAGSPL